MGEEPGDGSQTLDDAQFDATVGVQLRQAFSDVLKEPLPKRMLELLERLDDAEEPSDGA